MLLNLFFAEEPLKNQDYIVRRNLHHALTDKITSKMSSLCDPGAMQQGLFNLLIALKELLC